MPLTDSFSMHYAELLDGGYDQGTSNIQGRKSSPLVPFLGCFDAPEQDGHQFIGFLHQWRKLRR